MDNQRKDQNKDLRSGERQVKNNIDEIDNYHVRRYEKAREYIHRFDTVYDIGMGCGYGSFMLAQIADIVVGIDDSQEAVQYARQNWAKENIAYLQGNAFDVLNSDTDRCDTIIAFEILEHIKDDRKLIQLFKTIAQKHIIISVPHVSVPLTRSKWHWRHYTEEDIRSLFYDNNWYLEEIITTLGKDIFAVFTKG